jgi:hypothetical protein
MRYRPLPSIHSCEMLLNGLNLAVADAVAFFEVVDEELTDGHQSAREVVSHLVFWHREYVAVLQALAANREACLKKGTFASLDRQAAEEFRSQSMVELARRLGCLQLILQAVLHRLPDWGVYFIVKDGGRSRSVRQHVSRMEKHIRIHVRQLRSAQRHGEAWVRAYYQETA